MAYDFVPQFHPNAAGLSSGLKCNHLYISENFVYSLVPRLGVVACEIIYYQFHLLC